MFHRRNNFIWTEERFMSNVRNFCYTVFQGNAFLFLIHKLLKTLLFVGTKCKWRFFVNSNRLLLIVKRYRNCSVFILNEILRN